jgi:Phosphodiester glycosidase
MNRTEQFRWKIIATLAAMLGLLSTLIADSSSGWQLVAPGMELKRLASKSGTVGDSQITVLRIDPGLWDLQFFGAGSSGESSSHTARAWSEAHNLTAVINAGMFDNDGKTHLGYLRYREQVSNSHINAYKSVAAFDPRDSKLPRFHIFDLDSSGVTLQTILKGYASAVQNLRLIKRPGAGQWGQQKKKWSEAALGEDSNGRILFIFSRSPFSMHDLNQELLSAGIGLVAAQHLEGGPEAQLYIHTGKVELEMFGSYETSFREDNSNAIAWPIPNILGVRLRTASH